MKSIILILALGILHSCGTNKKDVVAGFTAGTIVHSELENDCAYTIKVQVDNEDTFYDPINLEKDFMKDGLKVQFQYTPLKMKNRCNKANPVSITKIVTQ